MQLPGGYLSDKYGPKKIASIAILWWSIFTAVTGMAANLTQMIVCRIVFGLGEGIFPGCSFKIMSAWFSRKEIGTALGIRMSANSFGSAITPIIVVAIMAALGWRYAFYFLSLIGIALIIIWRVFATDKPSLDKRVSAEELALIEDDDVQQKVDDQKIKIGTLLTNLVIWRFFMILFGLDMSFWGFSSWLPSFLVQARGFSMAKMGIAASLPFFGGILGCVLGGWVSDKLVKSTRRGRRIALIASLVLASIFLYLSITADSPTVIVVWLCLTGAFVNFSSTAFWALSMSVIPTSIMGTVSGFLNFAGQLAAFLSPLIMGFFVQISGGTFYSAFMLLIGSSLFSCLLTFTVKEEGLKFEIPG
jgi:sugar phosphate permease